MPLDIRETLRELVAIPSVNPMGRPLAGPECFEERVTDYLEARFCEWGVRYFRQPVHPRRDNIVAVLGGTPGQPAIMLEAHQDTVPVDGMTIDPWTPLERDGRLYGRGACDIKGGMTAMLAAFHRCVEEQPRTCPTVIMACTVNEEHGYTGATALASLLSSGHDLIPRRPDYAIVAEPTNLHVVVAHKGAVRWRCHTHGRAAHSSRPEEGENAIFGMARVLAALETYQQQVVGTLGEHPRCGRPTLSVGTIQGGLSVNTVPDLCTIEIDRRLLPGEDRDLARKHVMEFVAGRAGADTTVSHEAPFLVGDGLPDDRNRELAASLLVAANQIISGRREMGVPYGTDAAVFAKAGIPSVVFGPGSIDQAHTADEWVELAEVEQAAEALCRWIIEPRGARG